MRITYDEAKRLKTLTERDLDFGDAVIVFARFHLTKPDHRFEYGEDRNISIGALGDLVVVLVWTERETADASFR